MGEIDTKPIESVQTAISFFGQRNDYRRNSPTKDEEVEKERELETLEKELANAKIQLETKDSAYKQALLNIDHHHQTSHEILTLLKTSDLQKEYYISEFREANVRINELESAFERMAHQLSESENAQEQLSHVTNDLVSTQIQLLYIETEFAVLRDQTMESLSKSQELERDLSEEKRRTEALLRQVSEMNEAIMHFKLKVAEVEREKDNALSAKEAALESAAKTVSEAEEKLEFTKKQLENLQDLENQLVEKSTCINTLELELKQANELQEKKLDEADYISLLEAKLEQLRTELCNANECVEKTKTELENTKEKENDAQVEIALLKFQLHKGRSKLSSAEAAELRAQSEKSALYNALQQMGLEAEETKRENRMLKEAMKFEENDEANAECIDEAMPLKNQVCDNNPLNENDGKVLENVKRELEVALAKVVEFRTRAEHAISRADAAEKGKAALEEQMKRRKVHKERRKAALEALREESVSRDFGASKSIIEYDASAVHYQPLGKVLNMKF